MLSLISVDMGIITEIINENTCHSLIGKYNVPGPRYTSYPTVPYWDNDSFSTQGWISRLKDNIKKKKAEEGISIYIHLPFCESLCTYCGCNTRITVNHKVERPYIDSVLKEWSMYKELLGKKVLIKELHLGGGTPTFFSPENLSVLLKGILNKASISEDAAFSFEAHPGNTSKEHLETLYGLGFRRLSLGIQDFNPEVQEIINRYQSYDQVKNVTELAREIGYSSVNFDLIYGLPLQTLPTIKDTIAKVNQLKPDRIAFYSYAHVPWIKPGQRKFTEKDLPADKEKRALYEEGRKMLEEAGYAEIGMDHFALPGDSLYEAMQNKCLHRNFMGYTSGKTEMLIGLGVSSISDCGNAFAQNVKTVEQYHTLVNSGTLPVFRGHFLNEEDMILRKHISNIMCHQYTWWGNYKNSYPFLKEGIDRMKELEEDGLVIIDDSSLRVTNKGIPFLRNICMCLDARLFRDKPVTAVFSSTI